MVNGVVCLVLLSVFASNSVQQQESPNCPLGPVVTSTYTGRLGNNVWDYASILALARLLPGSQQPYIRQYHADRIIKYFKGPLLPIIEKIPLNCSCWNDLDLLNPNEGKILSFYSARRLKEWNETSNVILHSPVVAAQAVMHELEFIKSHLQYKEKLIEDANKVFREISSKLINQDNLGNQSLTFVGVHVRRTDYLKYLSEEKRAGAVFFNFAFDYFRNRKDLGKCVFLVVSDDNKWVNETLISNETNVDVFLAGNGVNRDPGKDIALLSLCNHSIFDYGSFGLWGAVYAGGEVVTTSSYYKQAHPFIVFKNFHFFEELPNKELYKLSWFEKPV